MSLQKKILAGYGLALVLASALFLRCLLDLRELGQASEAILRENYRSIAAAGQLAAALDEQDRACLLVLLGQRAEGEALFRVEENRFREWLGRARDNLTVPGEGQIIEALEDGYRGYQEGLYQILRLDIPGAAQHYRQVLVPAAQALGQTALRLRQLNEEAMHQASRRADTIAERAVWSNLALGALALLAGLAFSVLLSRRLVRPLRQLVHTAQRIGEGQYEAQVPATGNDELDQLAAEFNAMTRRLEAYHRLNVDQLVAEKQKNEAILRSIEDGLVVVDHQFQVANINRAACRLLGAAPEAAIGQPLRQLIGDPRVVDRAQKALATGQAPPLSTDNDVLTVDGAPEPRYLLFSITPVQLRPDELVGVVLLLRDVTRLKEVERLKSQFVMTASHELKTPLTSIGMSIELLLEGATGQLDERQNQLLAAAHAEVGRLKHLVEELLDLERIEAGRIDLEFDRVPVPPLCERVRQIFAAQAQAQGVELRAELPPELPAVRADANKITWVLTNLVSNALRYVGRGGHIDIGARQWEGQLHLSVRDDGIGIPPEYQSRIFDKFVQIQGPREHQGAGLGLAICREMVRAHRGAIWVESAPGAGSTFTFTLPLAEQKTA
jgi:NtrC-family two-component system sensor histidine kinase KinB